LLARIYIIVSNAVIVANKVSNIVANNTDSRTHRC